MMFILNKWGRKGMSPLLVTIFLVAFAVALGAVVMSWGSNGGSRESSTCDSVSISPQMLLGDELICYNESAGKLKVVVINSGSVDLNSIINRQVNSNYDIKDDVIANSALREGQVLSTELLLSPGRVRLELIPTISVLGDEVLCTGKSLIREDIDEC